jgi:excisionase family DNA binding protein
MDRPNDPLLKPGEVAVIMRVDPKTVTRWAKAGRVKSMRTPGGHHRFRESLVRQLLDEGFDPVAEEAAEVDQSES